MPHEVFDREHAELMQTDPGLMIHTDNKKYGAITQLECTLNWLNHEWRNVYEPVVHLVTLSRYLIYIGQGLGMKK